MNMKVKYTNIKIKCSANAEKTKTQNPKEKCYVVTVTTQLYFSKIMTNENYYLFFSSEQNCRTK